MARGCQATATTVRYAGAGTAILADGFSCRTQIEQLAGNGRRAMHLAELLAGAGGRDPAQLAGRDPA